MRWLAFVCLSVFLNQERQDNRMLFPKRFRYIPCEEQIGEKAVWEQGSGNVWLR